MEPFPSTQAKNHLIESYCSNISGVEEIQKLFNNDLINEDYAGPLKVDSINKKRG